jgi:AGCS family alanine or glycine:cation symporter
MEEILDKINALVWGIPALMLILGVGLYLTVRTGFVQLRLFPKAVGEFRKMLRGKGNGFQCLCTALGATVGTGNLVGVAGAICLGGPGSIFWMWVCGFLGMATKFAEATLAVRYRVKREGEWLGGPMYYIRNGLGENWAWMAKLYALLGIVAAFGVGNATQINAVVSGLNAITGGGNLRGNLLLGIGLAILVGAVLSGGAKRIGSAAERLVPAASAVYLILCLGVLIVRRDALGEAFSSIVRGAFQPEAVTGGLVGSAYQTLRVGCARGVFTNEAGMGTAGLAHGSAEVAHPVEQGLMGILEVFLDTIVICTLTALVILCSGIPISFGIDGGGTLTSDAFCLVCGDWVRWALTAAVCCFALATVMGWGLYGLRCAEYLLGTGFRKLFILLQAGTVILGATMGTGLIWNLAETVNGLMSLPNLIALAGLSGQVAKLTLEYKNGCNPRRKVYNKKRKTNRRN